MVNRQQSGAVFGTDTALFCYLCFKGTAGENKKRRENPEMKKIIALILTAGVLLSLCACGAGQTGGRIETEPAVSETEIMSSAQAEETSAETGTAAETEELTSMMTSMKSKSVLDAGGKNFLEADKDDFDTILLILDVTAFGGCWPDGFDRKTSTFADDFVAVMKIIDALYGTKEVSWDGVIIPKGYQGLTSYRYDYDFDSNPKGEVYKAHRKAFDPLFKFGDLDDAMMFYYSADAATVEWVEKELLGGTPDRKNLVKNDEWGESCYYCDGRYYFQISGHNGRPPQYTFKSAKQLEDGRYSIAYKVEWYGSVYTVKATAGLIEKYGRNYWKIYKIDWGD